MSQERTERRNFFETKEAVGTKIWALDSGIGEIIEMQHPYSFEMHNGVRWESEKIVDQYLDYAGVEGVSLKKVFPMEEAVRELIGLMNQSHSETQAAGRAAEMNMWQINRLTAERDAAKEAFVTEHREQRAMRRENQRLNAVNDGLRYRAETTDAELSDLDRMVHTLTAKVQERDAETNRLREVVKNEIVEKSEAAIGHRHALAERDKQIERLRAALKQARVAFLHIGKTPYPQLWLTTTAFEIRSIDAVLKGAE